MTTRSILILSIVFAEILFLGFSSTYQLPALNTEEMKTAVTSSVQKNILSKMAIEEREKVLKEAERISCNLGEEICGEIADGTITITATGGGFIYYCGMGENKWKKFNSFYFPKEEKNYYSNMAKYESERNNSK